MPAAASLPCVTCQSAAGKYKCTRCGDRGITCSLACSKQHKSSHDDENQSEISVSGAASTNGVSSTPGASLPFAPNASKKDHRALLQDYLFLSEMSRKVSDIGRKLSSERWSSSAIKESQLQTHAGPAAAAELALQMKEREEREARGSQRRDGKGKQKAAQQNGLTREQERRQLLAKQARFLRVPLLFLPDGMAMAKDNRSQWLRREGQLEYTVHFRCSACRKRVTSTIQLPTLHHQPPDATPLALLLGLLEQKSGFGQSNKQRKGTKRSRSGAQQKSPGEEAQSKSSWTVSMEILKQLITECDDGDDDQASATVSKVVSKPGADSASTAVTLDAEKFLNVFSLCLPVTQTALRNESSRKHLEWYSRQLDKGVIDEYSPFHAPDDGVAAQTPSAELSKQGGIDYNQPYDGAPKSATATSSTAAPTGSLLGSGLLAKLSAQINAARKPETQDVNPIPQTVSGSLEQDAGGKLTQSQVSKSQDQTADKDSSVEEKKKERISRTLVHVAAEDDKAGIQNILQRLPLGFSVVEYPVFEVWLSEELQRAEKSGSIITHALRKKGDVGNGSTDDSSTDSGSSSDSGDSDEESDAASISSSQRRSKASKMSKEKYMLQSTIQTYGSDSSETEEAPVTTEKASPARQLETKITRPTSTSATQTTVPSGLGSMLAYASDSDEDSDDGDGGTAGGAGIAGFARKVGMAPAKTESDGPGAHENEDTETMSEVVQEVPDYYRVEDDIEYD